MSCRSELAALLPFYAADTLPQGDRQAVAAHLGRCPACRQELAFWQEVGAAVAAGNAHLPAPPLALAARALAAARPARPGVFARARALLVAQFPLLRRELWLASALVMALGWLVAVLAGSRGHGVVVALAPLVAAGGVAMIYGPENDPSLELALATPTSPRQVLLARLALVFGYDLGLAFLATLGLLASVPAGLLGTIILEWLGPMAFLSALALLLSLCIGTSNAATVAFLLWLARGLADGAYVIGPGGLDTAVRWAAVAYAQAWQNPALLLGLAGTLVAAAVWLAGEEERFLGART